MKEEVLALWELQGHDPDTDQTYISIKRKLNNMNTFSDYQRIRLLVDKRCNVGAGMWDWQDDVVSSIVRND